MTVGPPRRPALQRRFGAVAAGCTTLAVVLLAPLAAGTGADVPPTAVERARLAAAFDGGAAGAFAGSEVARLYVRAVAGAEPPPAEPRAEAAAIGRARLRQLAFVGACAGLVYLGVLLARGRVQALLACAAFAVLPPVAREGALLRPEVPATAFALLAVLLLQSFAQTVARRRRRARWRRFGSLCGLGLCAAVALGLAAATLPSLGIVVVLPGLVLTVGAATLGVRALRIARRRGLARLPIRAGNARLLPWTALSLSAPAIVLLVLRLAGGGGEGVFAGTPAQVGLLPGAGALRAGIWGLVALGAVAVVLRTGLRLGRGGRLGAEVVLLVYAAIALASAAAAAPDVDRLPAAPAVAIVLAEGVRRCAFGVAWLLARRA